MKYSLVLKFIQNELTLSVIAFEQTEHFSKVLWNMK